MCSVLLHLVETAEPITPPDDQPPGGFNTAQFALAQTGHTGIMGIPTPALPQGGSNAAQFAPAQVSNIGIMDVPTPAFPQGGFNDAQSALVQVGNSGIMDVPIPALQQYMHPEVIDDEFSLQFVLGMGSARKYSRRFIQFLLIVSN